MVGLQPAEGSVQIPADLPGGQAGPVVGAVQLVAHGEHELGDEDDLLPAAAALGEPLADDLLAGAAAIHVGGVEEGDALLNGLVHDAKAFLLVAQSAKGHGAQADAADVQTGLTNLVVNHLSLSFNKVNMYPDQRQSAANTKETVTGSLFHGGRRTVKAGALVLECRKAFFHFLLADGV